MSDIDCLDNPSNVTREDYNKNMIEITFGGAIIKMCYRPPLQVSYQFDIHPIECQYHYHVTSCYGTNWRNL